LPEVILPAIIVALSPITTGSPVETGEPVIGPDAGVGGALVKRLGANAGVVRATGPTTAAMPTIATAIKNNVMFISNFKLIEHGNINGPQKWFQLRDTLIVFYQNMEN
jgi:hypothetical protein